MPIETVAYVAGAIIIYSAGLGTREAVRWALGEIAFTRAVRGELDQFLARFQDQTGQRAGLIDDVPPRMANPQWLRDLPEPVCEEPPGEVGDPDDPYPYEDDYPRDEARVTCGAWRRETVRGGGQSAGWPVNGVEVGRHHEPDGQTRDLSAFLGYAHVESEVAAP